MNEYVIEISNSTERKTVTVQGAGVQETVSAVLDAPHGFLVMSATVVSVNGRPLSDKVESLYIPARIGGLLERL